MKLNFLAGFFLIGIFSGSAVAQKLLLNKKNFHLRHGVQQEWSAFPVQAKDSQLVLNFDLAGIGTFGENQTSTLCVTQDDINYTWKVIVNQQQLGNLEIDEKKITTCFEVPPGLLKKNSNTIIIKPEGSNGNQPDDIYISNITLENHPLNQILSEGNLNIHVTDEEKKNIPSKLTIINEQGALQPLMAVAGDSLAVRTGVIYSGTGNYSFSVPSGKYKIYAGRGYEYGVDSILVTVKKSENVQKNMMIEHEVKLNDWVGFDTHVHTLEYSGHGDATMKERVLTIAGEGLDYAVITEHNKVVNIEDTVRKMGMSRWFKPIMGDELTTKVGHFNIFPVSTAPTHDVDSWDQVVESAMSAGAKVIIFNHARDIHNGFRPFDSSHHISIAGKSNTGWEFPANAMEVMNSGSQQTNPQQLYLDWMGLLNRGIILSPVGSSDSHDVSRFVVGQSRTYILKSGDLIENFMKGKVGVSFGLFTEMIINTHYRSGVLVPANENSQDSMQVALKIYAPSWIKADRITLYSNGIKIFTSKIFSKSIKGLVGNYSFSIAKPSHDVVLVAVAEGAGINVPWWPIAKPYQHFSPEVNPIVLGLTGAIKIDADGDGNFSSAYEYAKKLFDESGKNIDRYLSSLDNYDEAVAIQAASILEENNIDISRLHVQGKIKTGFDLYRQSAAVNDRETGDGRRE